VGYQVRDDFARVVVRYPNVIVSNDYLARKDGNVSQRGSLLVTQMGI